MQGEKKRRRGEEHQSRDDLDHPIQAAHCDSVRIRKKRRAGEVISIGKKEANKGGETVRYLDFWGEKREEVGS